MSIYQGRPDMGQFAALLHKWHHGHQQVGEKGAGPHL